MTDGEQVDARRGTRARHDAIHALLRTGEQGVDQLAEQLGVSASTVRRDLARMEADGRVVRTHGGAVRTSPTMFVERPYVDSAHLRLPEKRAVAALAAAHVPERASVFVDAGSTCLELARHLLTMGPRRVVTRGLEAALLLTGAAGIELEMLGGTIRPQSHGASGVVAVGCAMRGSVDVAFLGADVLHPEHGVGEPTPEETAVKEAVARRAGRTYVLVDSAKVGRTLTPAWTPLQPGTVVVTDDAAPADVLEELRTRVEVLVTAT